MTVATTVCPDGEHTYYRTERHEYCDSCGLDWDDVRYCHAPVRGSFGARCGLDKGHRGHHSCVARYCDGCGRMRRASQIHANDDNGQFCWWCCTRWEREHLDSLWLEP